MKRDIKTLWFFTPLWGFLTGGLVDSSSLSSATHFLSISSTVGNQAVLPCSWKSQLGEVAPPTCHIQWVSPVDTVFEQRGEERWQAEEFGGRAAVPEEKLGSGDCSLIINDVQIADTGRYESFMVVDGEWSKRTRVLIQSVKLSVLDHKSLQSCHPGEDVVLQLHTRHSFRVVFQGRNSSEWVVLWMRGDENGRRVEKHPLLEQLTLKKLRVSDEGTYKVLDEHGLAVSTVQLSVEENPPTLDFRQTLERLPTGAAAASSRSAPLVWSVLISTFQILRLL